MTYQPEQDLLSDSVLTTIERMRTEFAALDSISSVVTILDVPLLSSPKVSFDKVSQGEAIPTLRTPNIDKELVRKEFKNSPIYQDLLTSADGRTTALQLNIKRDQRYQQLLMLREDLREQSKLTALTPDQ